MHSGSDLAEKILSHKNPFLAAAKHAIQDAEISVAGNARGRKIGSVSWIW